MNDLWCRHDLSKALCCPNKAMMVEFIAWSIRKKTDDKDYKPINGKYYMWDTYESWQTRLHWLGLRTIKKYLLELRQDEWIYAEHLAHKASDRTLYYSVNMAKYHPPKKHRDAQSVCIDSTTEVHQQHSHGAYDCTALVQQQHFDGAADALSSSLTNSLTKSLTKTLTERQAKSNTVLHKDCLPFDETMAEKWFQFAKAHSPQGRFNKIKFAEAIMKMRTKYFMTEQQIEYMLDWIKASEFWRKIALSPVSLLNRSKANPDISKLEQVINNIKDRKKTQSEKVMDAILATEADIENEILNDPFLSLLRST